MGGLMKCWKGSKLMEQGRETYFFTAHKYLVELTYSVPLVATGVDQDWPPRDIWLRSFIAFPAARISRCFSFGK